MRNTGGCSAGSVVLCVPAFSWAEAKERPGWLPGGLAGGTSAVQATRTSLLYYTLNSV